MSNTSISVHILNGVEVCELLCTSTSLHEYRIVLSPHFLLLYCHASSSLICMSRIVLRPLSFLPEEALRMRSMGVATVQLCPCGSPEDGRHCHNLPEGIFMMVCVHARCEHVGRRGLQKGFRRHASSHVAGAAPCPD